ncbi:hypothetical protein OG216_02775 [Streptomycetaceae bacterium NBC_01309]
MLLVLAPPLAGTAYAASCDAAVPTKAVPYVKVRSIKQNGGRKDDLFQIAQRTLHNGDRWTEIGRLNKNKPQPFVPNDAGLRCLENPEDVLPGWFVQLPGDADRGASGVEFGGMPTAPPPVAQAPARPAPQPPAPVAQAPQAAPVVAPPRPSAAATNPTRNPASSGNENKAAPQGGAPTAPAAAPAPQPKSPGVVAVDGDWNESLALVRAIGDQVTAAGAGRVVHTGRTARGTDSPDLADAIAGLEGADTRQFVVCADPTAGDLDALAALTPRVKALAIGTSADARWVFGVSERGVLRAEALGLTGSSLGLGRAVAALPSATAPTAARADDTGAAAGAGRSGNGVFAAPPRAADLVEAPDGYAPDRYGLDSHDPDSFDRDRYDPEDDFDEPEPTRRTPLPLGRWTTRD